jgi:hypothetical protein
LGHFRNAKGEEAGTITHSGFPDAAGARDRFTNTVNCPRCGQTGGVTWEENAIGHREAGPQRLLIDVTPGFHAEAARTASGDPLIVCTKCDAIQPD